MFKDLAHLSNPMNVKKRLITNKNKNKDQMGGQQHQADIKKDENVAAENTAETVATETATENENTAPETEAKAEETAEANGEGAE